VTVAPSAKIAVSVAISLALTSLAVTVFRILPRPIFRVTLGITAKEVNGQYGPWLLHCPIPGANEVVITSYYSSASPGLVLAAQCVA